MKLRIILFVIAISSSGCAMATCEKLYPLPETGVSIVGDKLYYDGKLFAELRYLAPNEFQSYRGLAIYYYRFQKEVWIYPREGWRIYEGDKEVYSLPEIQRVWDKTGISQFMIGNTRADKREFISTWCHDVHFSEDGKFVYYKTQGIFSDRVHKYLVEYGISE